MQTKYFFYRLPAELLEQHGPTVAAVYSVLLNGCTEGIFRTDMKIEVLAQKCGITERQTRTVITKLEELGLVRRVKDGRRTVYDIVPVLPPKQHGKEYVPEPGKFRDETYEEMILRLPSMERQNHFREQLRVLGIDIKRTAYMTLRHIDADAEWVKAGRPHENKRIGDLANDRLHGYFMPMKGVDDDGEN